MVKGGTNRAALSSISALAANPFDDRQRNRHSIWARKSAQQPPVFPFDDNGVLYMNATDRKELAELAKQHMGISLSPMRMFEANPEKYR